MARVASVKNALIPALGGPLGAHARAEGIFFRPLPWALLVGTVLFAVAYLRHVPCLTTSPDNPINAYIRACYSDISHSYLWHGWAAGGSPLGTEASLAAPLIAVFVVCALQLARLFGAEIGADASEHAQYAGTPAFFGASTLLLFVCFLATIIASAAIAERRGRPWDVMLIAASPAVFAAGLTSWELLPLSLTVAGFALLVTRHRLAGAIVFGLAAAASPLAYAFIAGVLAALGLRRQWLRLWHFGAVSLGTALALHLPILLTRSSASEHYWKQVVDSDIGPGSVWFLLQELGLPLRDFGPFTAVVTLLVLAIILAWAHLTERTPSAGTASAIILLVIVLLAPSYPPQLGVWVVFALFAAIPVSVGHWVYSFVLAVHYLAVWGWLGGHLRSDQHGPWGLYYLAVLLRFGFEIVWLVLLFRQFPPRKSLPDDLVEVRRRHADGDGNLVTHGSGGTGAIDEDE